MLSVIHSSTSLCLQPSTATTTPAHSTKNTSSRLPAPGFATKAPQPYGIIPPRRKMKPISATHPHSSSTSPLPSPSSSSSSSTSTSRSFFFSDSPSSSRPGFWASLKAQYLDLSGYYRGVNSSSTKKTKSRLSTGSVHDFAPPVALLVSNSSPIVTLDATPLITSSSSTDDAILSLPNVDSLSWSNSSMYPVSVAAMDKFKVMHTDIIPLKTFTYCETLVEEVKRPSRSAAATARSIPLVKRSMPKAPPLPYRSGANTQIRTDELPLPRHLASRETRSNSDYLRMMASEISMIRSRKLIAPLKPRGYLPRRKDLFRTVKSSLSASLEMPCEEDDHSLFVGSWTSVSSTETFLSASSSCYATADDEGFD